MAYEDDSLRPVGGNEHLAGEFIYETTDTLATVEGAGYFDDASDRLEDAALLRVVGNRDGTPAASLYLVDVSSGSVSISVVGPYTAA